MKLNFGNCDSSKNLTILLNSDTLFGLTDKDKKTFAEMAAHQCPDSNAKLHVDLQSTTEQSRFGKLVMFGCKRFARVGERSEPLFEYFEAESRFMSRWSDFYFNLKSTSSETFSADLVFMIDSAIRDKTGGSKVQMVIDSFAPISVSVSRCRSANEDNMVVIVENSTSGVVDVDFVGLKEVSMLPKCSIFDDNEALFLHIKSNKIGASGSVKFSFVAGPESDADRTIYSFNMTADSSMTRLVNLEAFADETLMNRSTMGYHLDSNDTVEFFISRCRTSSRQLLGAPSRTGVFKWSRYVVEGIAKVMRDKCDVSESMEPTVGYLHMFSAYGAVNGVLTFARLKPDGPGKSSVVNYVPFVHLSGEHTASESNDKIVLLENDLLASSPVQLDLKYFTRRVIETPYMNFVIETSTPEPVTLIFSRCQDDSVNQLTVEVAQHKVLNLDQVKELHRLMRTFTCKNNAKYGLFVSAKEQFRGSVAIFIQNFRAEMDSVLGDYSATTKNEHHVPILLDNYNRSISIRISNVEDQPVLITASMCSKFHPSIVLWHEQFTIAHFKFDSDRLNRLNIFSGDCKPGDPAADKMVLFLTIHSDNARGRVTIDKIADDGCDGHVCSDGAGRFYENTNNMIIAQ